MAGKGTACLCEAKVPKLGPGLAPSSVFYDVDRRIAVRFCKHCGHSFDSDLDNLQGLKPLLWLTAICSLRLLFFSFFLRLTDWGKPVFSTLALLDVQKR